MKSKIVIKANNTKDETKAFLLQREFNLWLKDNQGLFDDFIKLSSSAQMFHMKWGIPIELGIGKYERVEGRSCAGMDGLFNAWYGESFKENRRESGQREEKEKREKKKTL